MKAQTSVRQWQDSWLREVSHDVQTCLEVDDLDKLRARNERLSSYLATLTILMGSHRTHIDKKRDEYAEHNLRPIEKGITSWKEGEKHFLREADSDYEFLVNFHQDISTKISVCQSTLRTKSEESKRV